jgi:membrane protease YdiL (CAAX protease family)
MELNTKSPAATAVGSAVTEEAPAAPGRRELLGATAGLLLLLVAFDLLGSAVGWVGSNLLAFVAATFLLLPDLVWPAGRTHPSQADRPRHEQLRGIAIGVALGSIVFAGFVPGYHLWNTQFAGRKASPALSALRQPANEMSLRPASTPPTDLTIERDGRDLLLHWEPASAATLALQSDGQLERVSGAPIPTRSPDGTLRFAVPAGESLALRLRVEEAHTIAGTITPATDLWLGSDALPDATAFAIPYNLRWIPWMLLMQVVLVAIPEETFFRGYLLRRFARLWPSAGSERFLHISAANLASSAIFALAHFAIGFHPARLAVFFPSLLFGRLAERTGGIAASVTLHVLSNLMMQLVSTQYLP